MSKKKTETFTDSQKKDIESLAKELEDYLKNPALGIHTDKLIAFIGDLEFHINPNGHTKIIRDQLRNIAKKYAKDLAELKKKESSRYDQEDLYENASKEILTLGLVGFNYDESANDPKAGPLALGMLAEELNDFLVGRGSKAGSKHWEMQQKLVSLQALSGLKD